MQDGGFAGGPEGRGGSRGGSRSRHCASAARRQASLRRGGGEAAERTSWRARIAGSPTPCAHARITTTRRTLLHVQYLNTPLPQSAFSVSLSALASRITASPSTHVRTHPAAAAHRRRAARIFCSSAGACARVHGFAQSDSSSLCASSPRRGASRRGGGGGAGSGGRGRDAGARHDAHAAAFGCSSPSGAGGAAAAAFG